MAHGVVSLPSGEVFLLLSRPAVLPERQDVLLTHGDLAWGTLPSCYCLGLCTDPWQSPCPLVLFVLFIKATKEAFTEIDLL